MVCLVVWNVMKFVCVLLMFSMNWVVLIRCWLKYM